MKPIYNPLAFVNPDYMPQYWPDQIDLNATIIFDMNDVSEKIYEISVIDNSLKSVS